MGKIVNGVANDYEFEQLEDWNKHIKHCQHSDDNLIKNEPNYYAISKMSAYSIYDKLIGECSFHTVIQLYKLLKHKIEYLEDEVVNYCDMEEGK